MTDSTKSQVKIVKEDYENMMVDNTIYCGPFISNSGIDLNFGVNANKDTFSAIFADVYTCDDSDAYSRGIQGRYTQSSFKEFRVHEFLLQNDSERDER